MTQAEQAENWMNRQLVEIMKIVALHEGIATVNIEDNMLISGDKEEVEAFRKEIEERYGSK